MGRARIKSKSCSDISSCSTRVYDALSTHEYTKMNASALMYSSYDCRQWKCRTHPNTHVSMQLIASERASVRMIESKERIRKNSSKWSDSCSKNMKWCICKRWSPKNSSDACDTHRKSYFDFSRHYLSSFLADDEFHFRFDAIQNDGYILFTSWF